MVGLTNASARSFFVKMFFKFIILDLFVKFCIEFTALDKAENRYLPAYQAYVKTFPSTSQFSKKPAFCISEQDSVKKICSTGFLKSS